MERIDLQVLDDILGEEIGAKHRRRMAMGITIAHIPTVKTPERHGVLTFS